MRGLYSSSIKIRLIRLIGVQKNKISVRKDKVSVQKKIKIRVQKDKIRVPCTASPAIPVICVYVHAHTLAPACVYFIR